MSDPSSTTDHYPPAIALSLPVAEVGLLFNWLPVAVFGIAVFNYSIAGITNETGHGGSHFGNSIMLGFLVALLGISISHLHHPLRGTALIGGAILGVLLTFITDSEY